jgi:ArsR family transcriptional regulator, arsenate/arsenite/antimonite-responsive transcriptional repressor
MDDREARTPEPTFRSTPSLACDLTWILWVALKAQSPDNHPLAAELLGGRQDLIERIRAFWADDGPGVCFTELQILAHHAGALGESSPGQLWAALEGAIPTVRTDLGLESESPEDRAVFRHRLERLKASPALVGSYLDLLRDVWAVVDATWQAARPGLEESGRHVVGQLESGRDLAESVGAQCDDFRSWVPAINAHVASGQPLLVVPCLFFGNGLYLEFPDLTLVGSAFRRDDAAARARTESLARRLKTVADPTRLALLNYLAATPSTVGDLAASFGLAQPTVSMHMKSLRGSGLVRSERKGGRVQLSADPDAVETLLQELRSVVVTAKAVSA